MSRRNPNRQEGGAASGAFAVSLYVEAQSFRVDVGQAVRRPGLSAGFSLADEAVGLPEIADIGPAGDFLVSNLTAKYFRASQFSSTIWPFLSMEKWQEKGEPAPEEILRKKTCDLLGNPTPPNDSKDLLSRGEEFLAAKGMGV